MTIRIIYMITHDQLLFTGAVKQIGKVIIIINQSKNMFRHIASDLLISLCSNRGFGLVLNIDTFPVHIKKDTKAQPISRIYHKYSIATLPQGVRSG